MVLSPKASMCLEKWEMSIALVEQKNEWKRDVVLQSEIQVSALNCVS